MRTAVNGFLARLADEGLLSGDPALAKGGASR